jgi:hypothetical protein
MKAIFEGLAKDKKSEGKSEEKSNITNKLLRYREPLNDTPRPSNSPGGKGSERQNLGIERELREFYDWEPGDKLLSKEERERYRQRRAQTPRYQGQGKPMQYDLLNRSKGYPEVSQEEFAKRPYKGLDPLYRDLARQRKRKKGKKGKSPYKDPPYKIPPRGKLQLCL